MSYGFKRYPGFGWNYSDTGCLLLGFIVEYVTAEAYWEMVTNRFLTPLDLTIAHVEGAAGQW